MTELVTLVAVVMLVPREGRRAARTRGVGLAVRPGWSRPAIVMVHEAVPLAIVTRTEGHRVRRACVTVGCPHSQPLKVMVGAAEVQRKALGRLGEGNARLRRVGPCWSASRIRLVVAPSFVRRTSRPWSSVGPPC